MPCDFSRVGVRAGDTQKVPEAFEERTRLLLAARGGGAAQACPKGTPEGGAAGLGEWPISEHCELSCQESGAAGRRRLKRSSRFISS